MSRLIFVSDGNASCQRWHARLARSGVLEVVLAMALLLGLLAQVQSCIEVRSRRSRLLERGESLRVHAPAAVAALDAVDEATSALAVQPWPGDVRGSVDLSQRGLYLRAVIDEVRTGREVHHAAQGSRKDVLLACLAKPPTNGSASALHEAAIRYRWRVDLDAATPNLLDLDRLGPAVAGTRTFLEEVRTTSDPSALRLLELERAAVPREQGFDFAVIALDELPTGFPPRGGASLADAVMVSRLDDIAPLPHVMRVAVIELATHHLLARVRTSVDVRDLGIPSAMSDAEEVHACQAAVALLGR
jgi:hypothetical protein